MSKDKATTLSEQETRSLLADTFANAAMGQLSKIEEILKSSAAKTTTGNLNPEEGVKVHEILPLSLGAVVGLAVSRLEASKEVTLNSEAFKNFKDKLEHSFDKIHEGTQAFSGGEKEIAAQIASIRKNVDAFKAEVMTTSPAKATDVAREVSNKSLDASVEQKPQGKITTLSSEETKNLLSQKADELSKDYIVQVENSLKSNVRLDDKQIAFNKNLLQTALRHVPVAAVQELEEIQGKLGVKLDPKAVEDFKREQEGPARKMSELVMTKDFSGGKEKITTEMQKLRDEINVSKDSLQTSTPAKATDVAREASTKSPEGSVEQKPQGKTTTLSSHDSWNKIIEEVSKRAEKTVDANQTSLQTLGNDKLDLEGVVNNRANLGEKLKESFKQTFDDPNFTKDLDPKTVALFKKNSDKLAEHIINNAQDPLIQDRKADVADITANLKHSVTEFQQDARVITNKGNKVDWQKVEDFCKSIKLNKLADFCHDKHVESLAKEVSKELKVDLANHPKGTGQDTGRKPVTPDQGKGR